MNQDDYDSLSKLAEQQKAIELRDWFAGMALQGLIAHYGVSAVVGMAHVYQADEAYVQADAIMKAREQ